MTVSRTVTEPIFRFREVLMAGKLISRGFKGRRRLLTEDRPGFWESVGHHNYGDPWKEQRYAGD
jgi:DMSO/TMAO reductase YedYZ molybdopterin-dependent catalytic subunit